MTNNELEARVIELETQLACAEQEINEACLDLAEAMEKLEHEQARYAALEAEIVEVEAVALGDPGKAAALVDGVGCEKISNHALHAGVVRASQHERHVLTLLWRLHGAALRGAKEQACSSGCLPFYLTIARLLGHHHAPP